MSYEICKSIAVEGLSNHDVLSTTSVFVNFTLQWKISICSSFPEKGAKKWEDFSSELCYFLVHTNKVI